MTVLGGIALEGRVQDRGADGAQPRPFRPRH